MKVSADLTCSQNTANLPHYGLIAAKVGCPIENEAYIVAEKVALVTLLVEQFDREANGLMILRMTNEFNLWPHPLASMSPVIRSLRDPL